MKLILSAILILTFSMISFPKAEATSLPPLCYYEVKGKVLELKESPHRTLSFHGKQLTDVCVTIEIIKVERALSRGAQKCEDLFKPGNKLQVITLKETYWDKFQVIKPGSIIKASIDYDLSGQHHEGEYSFGSLEIAE